MTRARPGRDSAAARGAAALTSSCSFSGPAGGSRRSRPQGGVGFSSPPDPGPPCTRLCPPPPPASIAAPPLTRRSAPARRARPPPMAARRRRDANAARRWAGRGAGRPHVWRRCAAPGTGTGSAGGRGGTGRPGAQAVPGSAGTRDGVKDPELRLPVSGHRRHPSPGLAGSAGPRHATDTRGHPCAPPSVLTHAHPSPASIATLCPPQLGQRALPGPAPPGTPGGAPSPPRYGQHPGLCALGSPPAAGPVPGASPPMFFKAPLLHTPGHPHGSCVRCTPESSGDPTSVPAPGHPPGSTLAPGG